MAQTWECSDWGRIFTKAQDWRLTVDGEDVTVVLSDSELPLSLEESEALRVTRGFFWSSVEIPLEGRTPIILDGIPNDLATAMGTAVFKASQTQKRRLEVSHLIATFDAAIEPISEWGQAIRAAMQAQIKKTGWLTRDFIDKWKNTKPTGALDSLLHEPEIVAHLGKQSKRVREDVAAWKRDFNEFAIAINKRRVDAELKESNAFFDKVEKSPLTEEQARSIICFDNRVLVIASAGSGKTSTMVAKAGYALKKGFMSPEQILLLAFNRDAAAELQERVCARLKPLGLDADGIVARTFHKFGLDVIGDATGRRPTLAPWVENGGDIKMLSEMIDALKDADASFRTDWDMFRVVLGRDLPAFGEEESEPEDWDNNDRRAGFRTCQGEVVKSRGECLIADWLHYNGVNYQYEAQYEVDTADPRHRQYRPDFYYPDSDTYHEHWALDQYGSPPPSFSGYLDGMAWKLACHEENGTDLIETTMADLWSGKAFDHLTRHLTLRGITLDPNPDRPNQNRRRVEHRDLVKTFRTFLTHAKSNRYSDSDLANRLANEPPQSFHYRHQMFLRLFARIRAAWEAKLEVEDVIDFEDMLNRASDVIESGQWTNPFTLVMVDEFQDASRARSRMTKALVNHPGRHLFAVGDDWQSINRFAGADISSMTRFEKIFGKATTLRLERTFRCPQSLCDTASTFVQKNGAQLRKNVRSSVSEYSPSVELVEVEDDDQIRGFIAKRLGVIAEKVRTDGAGALKKVSVFVLGRYRRDAEFVPQGGPWTNAVDVKFQTIHGSKGLEADYVILPRIASGGYSFPNGIQDDPVLQLAMPEGDSFPHAEERRLFYVALTRARRSVLAISVAHRPSVFMIEMVREQKMEISAANGTPTPTVLCPDPSCKGILIQRTGRYGSFLGCSRFPACRKKQSMAQQWNAR
jgi:DNA helicase IV